MIALLAALASFALSIVMLIRFDNRGFQFKEHVDWLSDVGVSYHMGVDRIAVLLIALTALAGHRDHLVVGHGQHELGSVRRALAARSAGMLGVFVALDLFIFYIFWEIMLIPMALLIGVWEARTESTRQSSSSSTHWLVRF